MTSRISSSVNVHDLRWDGFALFLIAAVFGIYMGWKIIRTPGEL